MAEGNRKRTFSDFYDITALVTKGAYSDVYSCSSKKTGKLFVVKKILTKGNDVYHAIRVYDEVAINKELNHENILELIEYICEGDLFYLVFPLMAGGDLFDHIAKRTKYTETDSARCIEQVLRGVAYLHNINIVHRDLRPENLLLTDEENCIVKITNFGLAVQNPLGTKKKHKPLGVLPFMAPESIKKKALGQPVDIWACGVLLYIMLVGQSPFCGLTNEKLVPQIKKAKYVWLDDGESGSTEDERVCSEAKDLVGNMIVKKQKSRITAEDALTHPFIRNNIEVASTFHRRPTLARLEEFNTKKSQILNVFSQVFGKHKISFRGATKASRSDSSSSASDDIGEESPMTARRNDNAFHRAGLQRDTKASNKRNRHDD